MSEAKLPEMTLMEHLTELRARLIASFIAIAVASLFCYAFAKKVFSFITVPFFRHFPADALIGTGPAEGFLIKLKVSFFAGIILASPFLFFQIWLFVKPGLYEDEKRLALPFVSAMTLLFLLGAVFCYYIALPLCMGFFYDEYQSIGLKPTIKISEQLSLVTTTILGFGVVFEFPLIAFLLARAGIVTDKMLMDNIRYAIFIIFVIAGIFTPPDVITQLIMVVPLLGLYGVSVAVVKYAQRR